MTIFFNNLKRIYRDRFSIITMLILPVAFISFAMFGLGNNAPLRVAVIDYDNTILTAALKEGLQSSIDIVELQEQEIKEKLINGKLDYAIKINKGFTEALIQGHNVKLETYSLKETNTSVPIRYYTEGFVNSAKNIANAAKGGEAEFYKGLELYLKDYVAADYISIENTERGTKGNTYYSLAFLIMFMLYMSINAATLVLEDKQLKTYARVLSTPVSARGYFVQNLLSFIVIMIIQVFAIFTILIYVFKADMGPSIFNLLVLFSVFAITSVALGVAVSSFAKDLKQASALSSLVTVPMCMLGGCFWPKEIMPGVLQQLGSFLPVTWVLNACEKLLYGSSLKAITSELAILLLFALVFLIIGSNKRVMLGDSHR